MKIFPAIDLKNNKCVRLSRGRDETSIIFNNNPVDQAIYFEQEGCERIHIVDLDAAFGRRGINTQSIIKIIKAVSIPLQIGGGIRSKEDAKKLFDLNVDYLIIGSFAINNVKDVVALTESYKQKIYISLDILKNKIMIKGWEKESGKTPKQVFKNYNDTNIKGYVLTDIENDGMLTGLNTKMILENLEKTKKNLIVGGGLSSYDDLKKLKKAYKKNLEGVIVGKSFYSGKINLQKAKSILNQNA
ncbi:MAG: 1-(5-phosphoribosyl)-5-[(5-phosphoribosylamino)methylideneamino] imidazole-4-carboxamide isomerase [Alphaproteobacteria bacterium MarineAlpha5_Bin5]|nr:MAG: 1-(5-phosphoribosyl)-5-[(5-phosphoribosylamino)methylideneamino] imidazole-4-carboxamide isomerase [Alphaproteobacteria bacterium MarineAlpha5_Bin5]PPR52732.1 MAG: 1-(5-phosphoribosyl)-5-[(5-phosphoribosylamino)methylideneamino] imidazole-4-carboxamide isomerase [Alphaproteobacteria bacterium MarineAlpha5_Bin4]|tara:strand:+ start:821 stop:1552 length:732 start_codon:yes stop_codon:yes gene_type:complete